MEPISVDFSVIKQKIIKTDELLQMYQEKDKKLKIATIINKNLKVKYDQATKSLNRLQLENERFSFSNESTKKKYDEMHLEHQQLMEQKSSLETKYSSLLVNSQSTILELEDELKMIKDLSASAEQLSSPKKKTVHENNPSKKFKELEVRFKKVQENEQKLREHNETLLLENKRITEETTKMKIEHSKAVASLQIEKSKVDHEFKQLHSQVDSEKHNHKIIKDKDFKISKLEAEVLALRELKEQVKSLQDQNKKLNSDLLYKDVALYDAKEKLYDICNVSTQHAETQTALPPEIKPCLYSCSSTQTDETNSNNDAIDDDVIDDIFKEMLFLPQMLSPMKSPLRESLILDVAMPEEVPQFSPSIPNIVIIPSTPLGENELLFANFTPKTENIGAVNKVEPVNQEIINISQSKQEVEEYPATDTPANVLSESDKELIQNKDDGIVVLDLIKAEEKQLPAVNNKTAGLCQSDVPVENDEKMILNEDGIIIGVLDLGKSEIPEEDVAKQAEHVDKETSCVEHETTPSKVNYLASTEKSFRRRRFRPPTRIKNFIKQQRSFKQAILLNKRYAFKKKFISRKLKTQDSVLRALQVLKRSKINFTISNESTLPLSWNEHDWLNKHYRESSNYVPPPVPIPDKQTVEKLRCPSYYCDKTFMLLSGKQKNPNLHGFFGVKKEPLDSRMEATIDDKPGNPLKWLNESLKKELTPENLLDTLADMVSQKLRDNNVIKRKMDRASDNSEFCSETETEIERLFPEDILERNKMLLKKAKYDRDRQSTSVTSIEENNIKNMSSQTEEKFKEDSQKLHLTFPDISNQKIYQGHQSNVSQISVIKSPVSNLQINQQTPDNKSQPLIENLDSNDSYKFHEHPDILSPLSTSTITDSPKPKKSASIENTDQKGISRKIEFKSPSNLVKTKFNSLFSPIKREDNLNDEICSTHYNSFDFVNSSQSQKTEKSQDDAMKNYVPLFHYTGKNTLENLKSGSVFEKMVGDNHKNKMENSVDGIVKLENANICDVKSEIGMSENKPNDHEEIIFDLSSSFRSPFVMGKMKRGLIGTPISDTCINKFLTNEVEMSDEVANFVTNFDLSKSFSAISCSLQKEKSTTDDKNRLASSIVEETERTCPKLPESIEQESCKSLGLNLSDDDDNEEPDAIDDPGNSPNPELGQIKSPQCPEPSDAQFFENIDTKNIKLERNTGVQETNEQIMPESLDSNLCQSSEKEIAIKDEIIGLKDVYIGRVFDKYQYNRTGDVVDSSHLPVCTKVNRRQISLKNNIEINCKDEQSPQSPQDKNAENSSPLRKNYSPPSPKPSYQNVSTKTIPLEKITDIQEKNYFKSRSPELHQSSQNEKAVNNENIVCKKEMDEYQYNRNNLIDCPHSPEPSDSKTIENLDIKIIPLERTAEIYEQNEKSQSLEPKFYQSSLNENAVKVENVVHNNDMDRNRNLLDCPQSSEPSDSKNFENKVIKIIPLKGTAELHEQNDKSQSLESKHYQSSQNEKAVKVENGVPKNDMDEYQYNRNTNLLDYPHSPEPSDSKTFENVDIKIIPLERTAEIHEQTDKSQSLNEKSINMENIVSTKDMDQNNRSRILLDSPQPTNVTEITSPEKYDCPQSPEPPDKIFFEDKDIKIIPLERSIEIQERNEPDIGMESVFDKHENDSNTYKLDSPRSPHSTNISSNIDGLQASQIENVDEIKPLEKVNGVVSEPVKRKRGRPRKYSNTILEDIRKEKLELRSQISKSLEPTRRSTRLAKALLKPETQDSPEKKNDVAEVDEVSHPRTSELPLPKELVDNDNLDSESDDRLTKKVYTEMDNTNLVPVDDCNNSNVITFDEASRIHGGLSCSSPNNKPENKPLSKKLDVNVVNRANRQPLPKENIGKDNSDSESGDRGKVCTETDITSNLVPVDDCNNSTVIPFDEASRKPRSLPCLPPNRKRKNKPMRKKNDVEESNHRTSGQPLSKEFIGNDSSDSESGNRGKVCTETDITSLVPVDDCNNSTVIPFDEASRKPRSLPCLPPNRKQKNKPMIKKNDVEESNHRTSGQPLSKEFIGNDSSDSESGDRGKVCTETDITSNLVPVDNCINSTVIPFDKVSRKPRSLPCLPPNRKRKIKPTRKKNDVEESNHRTSGQPLSKEFIGNDSSDSESGDRGKVCTETDITSNLVPVDDCNNSTVIPPDKASRKPRSLPCLPPNRKRKNNPMSKKNDVEESNHRTSGQPLSKEFIDNDSSDSESDDRDRTKNVCTETNNTSNSVPVDNCINSTVIPFDDASRIHQGLPCLPPTSAPPIKKPKIKPMTKLQSTIMRQMKLKRKMFQTDVPALTARNIQSNCDVKNSGTNKVNVEIRNVNSEMDRPKEAPPVNKKITVVQNFLIQPGNGDPVDLLKSNLHPGPASEPSSSQNNLPNRKRTSGYKPCDILSQIMGQMDRDRPAPAAKPQVALKDVPNGIEDKQWRKGILDIAEILHSKNEAAENPYGLRTPHSHTSFLLKKGANVPCKMKILITELLKIPNEEEIPSAIILEFKRLEVDIAIDLIIHEIAKDFRDKPVTKYYPAPLMTRTQRIYLGLLVRLEREMTDNVLEKFLNKTQLYIHRTGCGIQAVIPLTRVFLAICRLKADINRMRTFCCEAFFYVGDVAIPILFTVLTSWVEVLPLAADVDNYPMAKVLVQLVHLKTFYRPGFNLIPLRCLLHQYHGYPKERRNCDELFEEVFYHYLRHPTFTSDFAIRLYCRNKENSWVYKKVNELFKPLIYKIPTENVNFKATAILLMGKICRQFRVNDEHDAACLIELNRFFLGLIEDSTPELVKQSVFLSMDRLPKKKVKIKKSRTPQQKTGNNVKSIESQT